MGDYSEAEKSNAHYSLRRATQNDSRLSQFAVSLGMGRSSLRLPRVPGPISGFEPPLVREGPVFSIWSMAKTTSFIIR